MMGWLLTCKKTLPYIFFFCWGLLQAARAPISSSPSPCGWHRQILVLQARWDGVTQGGTVSPCSSAPLQPPEDWGQLERFSPSPGGGNHSTAFPAGSSGTGQERKGQVICGSRNPASPGFILGKISCLFPAQLFVVYGQ